MVALEQYQFAIPDHCILAGWCAGLLLDTLVEKEVHRQTVAVRAKFLPLSVWKILDAEGLRHRSYSECREEGGAAGAATAILVLQKMCKQY